VTAGLVPLSKIGIAALHNPEAACSKNRQALALFDGFLEL
jgi:hypothetical protein